MRIVVAYRGIPNSPGRATGDSMVRAFAALGHDAVPYGRWHQTCDWFGTDARGDMLVCLECNDADPQYDELRYFEGKRVYWEFDTAMRVMGGFPDRTPGLAYIDAVFLANRRCGGLWFGRLPRYLPYAFDPTCMTPSDGPKSGAAIVGSHFPHRDEFAAALGIEVRQAFGNDYAETVSSLLVHVHHYDSGGPGLIVLRPWETMGLGVALLAPRTPELEELFTDGVHCAMYDSLEDARAKLALLLASDVMREDMAARGRAEIMARHTFTHRAQTILEAVR